MSMNKDQFLSMVRSYTTVINPWKDAKLFDYQEQDFLREWDWEFPNQASVEDSHLAIAACARAFFELFGGTFIKGRTITKLRSEAKLAIEEAIADENPYDDDVVAYVTAWANADPMLYWFYGVLLRRAAVDVVSDEIDEVIYNNDDIGSSITNAVKRTETLFINQFKRIVDAAAQSDCATKEAP